jgi:hypothetical protein
MDDWRKDAAEKSRAIVLMLTEQMTTLLRESGATEEEALAALACAKELTPLLQLESFLHGPRYVG